VQVGPGWSPPLSRELDLQTVQALQDKIDEIMILGNLQNGL
jgi:hypothetical protein